MSAESVDSAAEVERLQLVAKGYEVFVRDTSRRLLAVATLADEWEMRALSMETSSAMPPPGHPDRDSAVVAFVLIQRLASELREAIA